MDQTSLTNIFPPIKSPASGIFQDFRNMITLGEDKCLLITGWFKKDFVRFCKYITSLNDTDGRTIEECVAIYRYWLRKGIDQTSLAYTKLNSSQQHMSHYLQQTRRAITKDFVSFWLGASKPREFFCSHKNNSVNSLHDLDDDDLVLIADGTYLRIEKSHNNDVQYQTYSGQKKCSLLKPFVITCADGWIVDVWGPYGGKYNDQEIFDHIFESDKELRRIMQPYKNLYLFLDRGMLILS